MISYVAMLREVVSSMDCLRVMWRGGERGWSERRWSEKEREEKRREEKRREERMESESNSNYLHPAVKEERNSLMYFYLLYIFLNDFLRLNNMKH